MVAHSGRGWSLAPCLIALEHEADSLAPGRSRESDGSIGDIRHQGESFSDHNPDGGYVHALDLTHDPAGGFDAHAHARAVADRRDPRVKYIISQGRIWDPVRGWHAYVGTNRHDHHAHWSVLHTQNARNNLQRWLTPAVVSPKPPPIQLPYEGTPAMLVQIEGRAKYAVVGNVATKLTDAQWDYARQWSIGAEVLSLPHDTADNFEGLLLLQTARATTNP